MKNNITITFEHLENYLEPGQLKSLCQRLDPNPCESVIHEITAQIRSQIEAKGKSKTVPELFKNTACHLIIEELSARIPGLMLTKDIAHRAKIARMFLKNAVSANAIFEAIDEISAIEYTTRERTTRNMEGL